MHPQLESLFGQLEETFSPETNVLMSAVGISLRLHIRKEQILEQLEAALKDLGAAAPASIDQLSAAADVAYLAAAAYRADFIEIERLAALIEQAAQAVNIKPHRIDGLMKAKYEALIKYGIKDQDAVERVIERARENEFIGWIEL